MASDREARRILRNAVIRARYNLLTDASDLLALTDDLGSVLEEVDGEWPDLDIEEEPAPDDEADLRVAEAIACHGGLADDENVYLLEGGIAITTGDQDDAWAWDISRPIAEQLAETARDDAAAQAIQAIHDADPARLAEAMAADGHTDEVIQEYTGLVAVAIEPEPDAPVDGGSDGGS